MFMNICVEKDIIGEKNVCGYCWKATNVQSCIKNNNDICTGSPHTIICHRNRNLAMTSTANKHSGGPF